MVSLGRRGFSKRAASGEALGWRRARSAGVKAPGGQLRTGCCGAGGCFSSWVAADTGNRGWHFGEESRSRVVYDFFLLVKMVTREPERKRMSPNSSERHLAGLVSAYPARGLLRSAPLCFPGGAQCPGERTCCPLCRIGAVGL